MRTAIPALTLVASMVASMAAATLVGALLAAPAHAKLPALSDEAKAKAAETAAKTAWTDKIGAYKLCEAMNRTAQHYRQAEKASGKEAPVAVETPACTDPGSFVAAPPASAPLEAAGAHSPTTMATSPPNSKSTAAEIQGQPKK